MSEVTLDEAIDVAMQLPRDQREMLIEILQRREVEARRSEIAAAARASLEAYRRGDLQPQSVEDAIRELHAALDDE